MGKKRYEKTDISKAETDRLGIPELYVLNTDGSSGYIETIHKRYFTNDKLICPACLSKKTRCSKVVSRKFKDILWIDKKNGEFEIIDLNFHQRYLRCDECGKSVFPEPTEFSDKGCRYTNRLSDVLADGTFRYSYKKVCQHYGVPASTASVGDIMRRRIRYRESHLPMFKTPTILSLVELPFFQERYLAVLAIWGNEIYCMDILQDSTEEACAAFFTNLDPNAVATVYTEPIDSVIAAAQRCFSAAAVVVTDEALLRYAKNAMQEIIYSDGKRFPVVHKYDRLTAPANEMSEMLAERISEGMSSRPRLKKAYEHYQKLLEIMSSEWSAEELLEWANETPDDVPELYPVMDIIEVYQDKLTELCELSDLPPRNYYHEVNGLCEAIKNMPHCIYDVLRGRCMFSAAQDVEEENGELFRYGIRVTRMIENINGISANIREEREYGYE